MDLAFGVFRNRLKRELPGWREEELVDEQAEATLIERYRLGEDGTSAAANGIPRLGHALTLLGTLIFGANIGGSAQAIVDARVGPDGTVALLRMRIGDRVFGE